MSAKYDVAGVISFLQEQPDINPDSYDGSYELLRETVKSYATLRDYAAVDYLDLNALYLMVIGTWKHGIDRKKETISASHLPEAEKVRLLSVIDKIWARVCAKEYSHQEDSNQPSMGMFGTGFYTFKGKTTDQCAKDFVRMCVDILTLEDEDSIFERVEQVLAHDFRGMKAASASVVLHCLNPDVFPILNGNMGTDNIFEAVGVKLKKRTEVATYITNCRAIRAFRDKNFDFRNYRVFDVAQWKLDQFTVGGNVKAHIDIAKLQSEIVAYKKEFQRVVNDENYKWEHVKCFQDNFDIDANDFPEMLDRAFGDTRDDNFLQGVNISAAGFHVLPEKVFDSLERFILENKPQDETQAWEFLSLSVKHGIKVISAKNYVGIITMNDGTTIEILPKLDRADETETIRVFRDMLSTVKDLPYKSFKESNVMSDRMTLFEVYIRMFLDEVGILIKRGLKSGYVYREENEPFLKGRLDFNRHIKTNLMHRERFFVGYDEFEANRPENRLIKSTLKYVKQKTHDPKNLRDSRRYLMIFADIDESDNYQKDFASYTANRNMMEYDTVLKWCRIFLMNKSFTAFKGSDVAFALLFPMEQLFESYVADRIRHHMDAQRYHVTAQDKKYHLFDSPRKFSLRPDIVVSNYETKTKVVLDTKWKMLSPQYQNYGISQADMYQMYVYHKKYRPEKVILLYPFNQSFSDSSQVMDYRAKEPEGVEVCAVFFDLLDTEGSLARIDTMMGI